MSWEERIRSAADAFVSSVFDEVCSWLSLIDPEVLEEFASKNLSLMPLLPSKAREELELWKDAAAGFLSEIPVDRFVEEVKKRLPEHGEVFERHKGWLMRGFESLFGTKV